MTARRVVFHADRGIEYAAGAFQERIRELGSTQSMNRPGKVTDNAIIESFLHSMKTDIYHGQRHQTDDEIRAAPKSYVPFHNSARLHPSLDYQRRMNSGPTKLGVNETGTITPRYALRAARQDANVKLRINGRRGADCLHLRRANLECYCPCGHSYPSHSTLQG